MKNISRNCLVVLSFALLSSAWGCADQIDQDNELENPSQEIVQTQQTPTLSLEKAVYHPGTESWIVPRKDPYTLSNFQQAYAKLSLGNSVQILTRVQADEFSGAEQLKATHYSLKIFPRNEKEQWKVELMEDVKVAYVPFDYVQLPEAEADKLTTTRSADAEYTERNHYTVTYDSLQTTEGPADPVTYTMPILYDAYSIYRVAM